VKARDSRPAGCAERGFTLLEVLVALTIVGIALLLGGGIHWRVQAIGRGLEVEAELLRRAQGVVESVRAGVHPLATGPVNAELAWVGSVGGEMQSMNLVVEPAELAGLCQVRVHGRSRGKRSGWHDVNLETLVWRPGASCK